ncbi:hypothetical protein AB0B07_33125 [Streptomyces sioyaensis]|uniref:hypothetical protein n=1 Tax=Streptomyces sioyaensis TaxID=67364 RepID=UPI0033DFFF59
MNVTLAFSVIGSLFIIAGIFGSGRIARHKVTGLVAIGAAFALARNVLDHNQFWSGVAALGLVLLAGATVSYYREARKAGDAR